MIDLPTYEIELPISFDEVQSTKREAGYDCENDDCECYVVKARKYLYWTSPNWG